MSQINDLFQNTGIPIFMEYFGDALTYTPPEGGIATPLEGILEQGTESVGDALSERMEQRWTLTVASDAGVTIGGVIDRGDSSWTVVQLLEDDGIMTRFAVRRVTP